MVELMEAPYTMAGQEEDKARLGSSPILKGPPLVIYFQQLGPRWGASIQNTRLQGDILSSNYNVMDGIEAYIRLLLCKSRIIFFLT